MTTCPSTEPFQGTVKRTEGDVDARASPLRTRNVRSLSSRQEAVTQEHCSPSLKDGSLNKRDAEVTALENDLFKNKIRRKNSIPYARTHDRLFLFRASMRPVHTTADIHDSKGILRILERVRWSDSPDYACEAQGSHRNNASASFLQRGPGGALNRESSDFLLPLPLSPYDHRE